MDENDGERLVPANVSVFDLIMPWKQEIKPQITKDLVHDKLAKIVKCSKA